jgi:hypothetical protein
MARSTGFTGSAGLVADAGGASVTKNIENNPMQSSRPLCGIPCATGSMGPLVRDGSNANPHRKKL